MHEHTCKDKHMHTCGKRIRCYGQIDVEPLRGNPLDLAGSSIGDDVVIGHGALIYRGSVIASHVLIGDYAGIREHVVISKHSHIGRNTVIEPYSRIGAYTKIQANCYLSPCTKIGDNCFLGMGVIFTDDNSMGHDPDRASKKRSAEVMDNVRIGSGAIILPNVIIGENAIVGAGAVVTKSVLPDMVVMGIPATVARGLKELEE